MVQRLSSRVSSVFSHFLILIALLVLLVQVVWESLLFYLNLSIFVWFVVLGCTFVLRKRPFFSGSSHPQDHTICSHGGSLPRHLDQNSALGSE